MQDGGFTLLPFFFSIAPRNQRQISRGITIKRSLHPPLLSQQFDYLLCSHLFIISAEGYLSEDRSEC